MALTTNKRNKIIAGWKTGKFKSYYAIAKYYSISQPIAKKMLVNISKENADIVAVGVEYEKGKKLTKNLVEIKAIEETVAELLIANEIESIVFKGTLANVKGVKKSLKGKETKIFERKIGQDVFDKALVTVGKAQRFANTNIEIKNKVEETKNLTVKFV